MAASSLRVSIGDERVIVLPVEREATIGRDRTCRIIVDEDVVSRVHAIVSLVDDCWVIEDAGSRNGMYVEGVVVTTLEVRSPMTVLLGHPEHGAAVTLEPVSPAMNDGPPAPSGAETLRLLPAAPVPDPARMPQVAPSRPGSDPAQTLMGPSVLSVGDFRQVSQVYRPQALVRIGRALDNDVVVDDLTVSRYHAEAAVSSPHAARPRLR